MLNWQELENDNWAPCIYRAAVPGGWLVRMFEPGPGGGTAGLTFMPDPDHAWDGSSVKVAAPTPSRPAPKR